MAQIFGNRDQNLKYYGKPAQTKMCLQKVIR